MSDKAEIQDIISQYHQYASIRDWDTTVATFTLDGVLEISSGHRFAGRSAIREALVTFTTPLEYVIQINAPALISLDGHMASARSSIRETGKFAGRDEALEAFGIYEDQLVRTEAGWRFTHRRFELRWMHRVNIAPS